MTNETNASDAYLPSGTRVISHLDGEPGTILNGYASNAGVWTEYEVETADGIEIWKRCEFMTRAEADAAAAE